MTNFASRLATAIGALAIAATASTAAFAGDGADLRAQQRNGTQVIQQAPVSNGGATAISGSTGADNGYQFHEARR